jgi:hypothetical protein
VRLVIKLIDTSSGEPEVRDSGEVRLVDGVAVLDEDARRFMTEMRVFDASGDVPEEEGERYIRALNALLRRGTYSGAELFDD